MLLSLLRSGDILGMLPLLIVSFPGFLLAISVHESAHAYAAYRLGDPTASSLGRITLDPRKHIDPIGAVLWLIVGFGWAKPVPIQSRYFKKPKRDMNIVSLAGPMSNFILAFSVLLIWGIFLIFDINILTANASLNAGFGQRILGLISYALSYFVMINVVLGVFNLLPIPPLDGSHLLLSVLPSNIVYAVHKYQFYIQIAFYAIVISGRTGGIVMTLADWVYGGMFWIVKIIISPFI